MKNHLTILKKISAPTLTLLAVLAVFFCVPKVTLASYTPGAFVTTWDTTKPGVNPDNAITIPTYPGDTYNYNVDWGDGNTDTGDTANATHVYATPGTYTVTITGTFPRIYFDLAGDDQKLIDIDQWGSNVWDSMSAAFEGCSNLTTLSATDAPVLTNVTDMGGMFDGATNFNSDVSSWDVSNVQYMNGLFGGDDAFNQDISSWDVSNVTGMSSMFSGAQAFNNGGQPLDWGSKTSNVTEMYGMFQLASSFNQDISGWNVSKVTDMTAMFWGASSFNNGDMGNDGSNPLSWGSETSQVLDMRDMFLGAGLFNQDVSSWDVSNVTDMSNMFTSAESFNNGDTGNDGSHPLSWGAKTSNVTDMAGMFAQDYYFNQDVSSWDVSNVTDMSSMFSDSAFNNGGSPLAWGSETANVTTMRNMFSGSFFNQDISGWNVSNVTDMSAMFLEDTAYNNDGVDLSWGSETSKVTDMNAMFENTMNFNQDIGGWDVSSVTGMGGMFYSDSIFNQDLSNWDVSNVTTMAGMFAYDTAFNNGGNPLPWGNRVSQVTSMNAMFQGSAFNQDVSGWDVSSVTDMSNMFSADQVFNDGGQPLAWGSKTSKVTDMYNMFGSDSAFNQDISSWDVSNVTTMNDMFGFATDFNNGGVDLSWGSETSKVTDMTGMFSNDTAFNQDISGWDVSSVTDMFGMFSGDTAFNNGGNPLPWGSETSKVTDMYAMFDFSAFNQDISGWDVSSVTDMGEMFADDAAFDQNLGSWHISQVTNLADMFYDDTLSTSNYDALLSGWVTGGVSSGETFGGGNSKYCNAVSARRALTGADGWTITDGGPCDAIAIALTSTIKGATITNNGNPGLSLDTIQSDGSGTISNIEAADTSNAGSFITAFSAVDPQASITKVVKYASGTDYSNFADDTAYNGTDTISDGDFFIVELTPKSLPVVYYKIDVSVLDIAPPTVTTENANPSGSTSENLSADIENISGNDTITERGFNIGTDTTYSLPNVSETSSGFSSGYYNLNATNLTCNTTYDFRAYAVGITGTIYGDNESFTTDSCGGGGGSGGNGGGPRPDVSNTAVSNLSSTSATLGGNITDAGGVGLTITSRGMYYLLDSYMSALEGGDFSHLQQTATDTGSSLGNFTENVTGLTCGTAYDYTAWAINSSGGQGFTQGVQGGGLPGFVAFTTLPCTSPSSETPLRIVGSSAPAHICTDPKATNYQASFGVSDPKVCQYATGVVPTSSVTPSTIILSTTRTLKLGMSGPDVKTLQQYLNAHNDTVTMTGKETTYFGIKTKKAVQQFQKAHGLTPDGVVGPKTRSVMI